MNYRMTLLKDYQTMVFGLALDTACFLLNGCMVALYH
jgi:hypothetical protein